jgi:hypothetical protein
LIEWFLKVNSPQNRQLIVYYDKSNQPVDGFVREMPFKNHLIDALCEMRVLPTLEPFPSAIGAIELQTSRGGGLQGYLSH